MAKLWVFVVPESNCSLQVYRNKSWGCIELPSTITGSQSIPSVSPASSKSSTSSNSTTLSTSSIPASNPVTLSTSAPSSGKPSSPSSGGTSPTVDLRLGGLLLFFTCIPVLLHPGGLRLTSS